MRIPHILFLLFTAVLLIASQLSNAYAPLAGITARSLKVLEDVDLSEFLSTPAAKGEKSMLVLGTYAADFNAIEYAQRYEDNPSLPFLVLPHNIQFTLSRADCDTTCPSCTREV